MRKVLFLLIMAGLVSCSNDEVTVKTNELVGEWNWVHKTGGIAGVSEFPKKGESLVLKINADNTFSFVLNGKETSAGKYTLKKGESMLLNKEVRLLVLNESQKLMYEIKGSSLYLAEDYYDGFNYEYVRIK